ncbi:MAG: Spx/MgsR family RNA polymerase-binding regulatory protein [Anaeroplasmataceae bacterium]
MVTIYTTNSCASCKKAVSYLKENNIKYKEINMFKTPITRDDIKYILENSENGFDDIISTRSKVILENNIDIDSMKFNEMVDFIIKNPSVLRRPIIVDDKRFQVGYDDDEITAFKPRNLREMFACSLCTDDEKCSYVTSLENIKK